MAMGIISYYIHIVRIVWERMVLALHNFQKRLHYRAIDCATCLLPSVCLKYIHAFHNNWLVAMLVQKGEMGSGVSLIIAHGHEGSQKIVVSATEKYSCQNSFFFYVCGSILFNFLKFVTVYFLYI